MIDDKGVMLLTRILIACLVSEAFAFYDSENEWMILPRGKWPLPPPWASRTQCPHQTFLEKHTCPHCRSIKDVLDFAKNVMFFKLLLKTIILPLLFHSEGRKMEYI